jgi:hypothetical protein
MSSGNGAEHEGANGARTKMVSRVVLEFDHETCLVTLDAGKMGLGLAQMILHEGVLQLEEQRRQAAALELRQRLQQAEHDARIATELRKGR